MEKNMEKLEYYFYVVCLVLFFLFTSSFVYWLFYADKCVQYYYLSSNGLCADIDNSPDEYINVAESTEKKVELVIKLNENLNNKK